MSLYDIGYATDRSVSDVLVCRDCGHTFLIRYGEKKWFKKMGYPEPCRCKSCRANRKKVV